MPLFVLAGYTGSGKTDVLHLLQQKGQQVINLEALASHNGSVFGHLPHNKPPSSYHFHKSLIRKWKGFDLSKPVFCENKASTLGSLQIPQWLFQHMQQAPMIWVEVTKEIRLQRLLSVYGNIEPLDFKQALCKLSNRLTEQQIPKIVDAFELGKKELVFQALMEYYDQGLYYKQTPERIIGEVTMNETSAENMLQILKLAESFFPALQP